MIVKDAYGQEIYIHITVHRNRFLFLITNQTH